MRIRRFVASDMRGALRQVREEHGDDAMILSTRRTRSGIEIVSAVDYDEALIQQFLGRAQTPSANAAPARPAGKMPAAKSSAEKSPAKAPAKVPVKVPVKVPAAVPKPDASVPAGMRRLQAVAPPGRGDAGMDMVHRELAAMRRMIESEMSRFAEERLRGVPVRALALDELLECGCDRQLARTLVAAVPPDAQRAQARGMVLGMLAKSLTIPAQDPVDGGGVFALVGPSGAGKTTTLAKLAARYAMAHGTRDVALVTTDIGRTGGREQLEMLGRPLGLAVHAVRPGAALAAVLEKLADYPLVLVDTGGGAPVPPLPSGGARPLRKLLVLPATAQAIDLDHVVRRFRDASVQGVVLSKIDETGRLGTGLSALIRHQLPLVCITDGPRVPDDLHRPEAHRLVIRMGELRRTSQRGDMQEAAHARA